MARTKADSSSGHDARSKKTPANNPASPQDSEWLRSVFEHALDGMAIADIETKRFVQANPAFCRMAGYALEELRRLKVPDIHPADRLAHVISEFERLARGDTEIAIDLPVLRRDGSIFYADINSSVVTFEGRPHLLGIFRDVTSRKRSEESLRRSESNYAQLYENLTDAFVSVDMNDRIREFNSAYRDMLGYSGAELMNLTYVDLTPPRWHDFEARIVKEEILTRGYSGVYEKEYRRKDGTVFPVELRTFLIRDEAGQPEAMWAMVRDITERRRTEAQLRSSEQRLQSLFNNMAEGVALHEVLVDEGGRPVNYRIVAINPQYEHVLNLRREDVVGKLATEVYGVPEPPYLAEFCEVGLTGRARRIEVFFAPMGKQFEISIAPWGEKGFATIFSDVTVRKHTEEALRESEDRYRAATELLSDYVFRIRVESDGRAVLDSVSDNFERITGRRLTDIAQPGVWLKTIHPEDQERMGRVLQRLIREGGEDHSEFRTFVLRNGKEMPRWVEVSSKAQTDSATGRVTALIGAVRDVTDRKTAELQQRQAVEALRASEARFRKIIEQSPMSMAIVGMDGTIEYINRKAIETFGYLPEDIPNMERWWVQAYPDEAYRKEVIATWTGHVERALAENREIRGGEYRVTCKDRSVKTVFIFGVPVAEKLLVMFEDITERKRAEEALRQRTEELTALNAVSREVSASLSMGDVATAALREMLQAAGTDLAFLFLREGERLVLHGFEPEGMRQRLGQIPEHKVGECMCGLAVKLGRAVYSRDILNDARCTWDECKKAGFRSFAALPLRSGSEIIGVLGLSSLTERDFELQDRFLETLASAVSVSVQNARLFAETRQAAQMIEDERQFSDSIIEGLPGVFYLFDEHGRFLRWNRNFETITGYEAEEIARLHPLDFFSGPEKEYLAGLIQKVFTEGLSDAEAHLVFKDGRSAPYFFTGIRIVSDGKPCLIGVGIDISARKRAEEALRERETQYRALIETTDTGYVILDGKGTVVDANPHYARLSGHREPSDIIGRSVIEWTSAHDAEKNAQAVRTCLEQGFVRNLEIEYVDAQGKTTPIEINATVLGSGDSLRILSLCRDITERKRAEEALRDREERYRATLSSMTDLVFVLDRGGRFVDYHAPQTTGLYRAPAEFLGKTFTETLPPAIAEPLTKAIEVIRTGGSVQRLDYEMEVQGQRSVWSANVSPRWDAAGQYDGATIVSRNMTEQKQLEERLHQSEKLTAIGQLAGGVAHDFNNQLAGVMGYASLLIHRLEEGPLQRYAQGIAVSAQRAADLTQQLLAFSRKGKYLSVPVDIHRLLGEVVAILERSIDKRIRIGQVLRASHPIVLGDPTQIQNALLNLALNARDAMAQGGELTFETELSTLDAAYCQSSTFEIAPGPYLCIGVTDTGSGMSEEVKRHLFEPFFTTKKVGEGTGMGLASVYGTVQNHLGAIEVTSELGRGTTFRIFLPLAPGATQLDETGATASPARGTGRILLVDDERTVREMATDVLTDLGYSVTTCADGQEAVEYYKAHWQNLDLVILDMVMPRMDGRAAFVAMRQINPGIRALLSSGYSLDSEAQAIIQEGVLAFIGKPYQQSELAQEVAEALARR